MSNETKKQLNEPLFTKEESYPDSVISLRDVCILDNHHKDETNEEYPEQIISSRVIVEELGGVEKIAQNLDTDLKTGIDATTVKKRMNFYGKNSFPPPKIKTVGELIMENFDDYINQVLLIAAFVSIIIGVGQHGFPDGMVEGTSILIALFIIIVVNSGNNYISERRLADLVSLSDQQEVAVFRGSEDPITIDSKELVVGDIIMFQAGQKVPADCIMVEGQDVMCIEGELTGEPDGVDKQPITAENYHDGIMCTMMAKSLVGTGLGKAMVLAVGPNSVAGVITEKTQTKPHPTLLQEKLETIASKIGNVGISVAGLTLASMIIRIALEMNGNIPCGCQNVTTCVEADNCEEYGFEWPNRLYTDLLNTIIIAITVIVVAIPEGLPLAVTISLSFSSAKMRELNNLVRKLASSETMGGATHICSDKTGTLTLNQMTVMACEVVQKAHLSGKIANTAALVDEVIATTESTDFSGDSAWDLLVKGVLWNSTARIEANDGSDATVTDEFILRGNVTEQGIYKFFMAKMGGQGCIDKIKELTEENTLCVISFTSGRKRASIVVRNPEKEGTDEEVRVWCKGAPDMVLDFTEKVICADGSIVEIDEETEIPENIIMGPIPDMATHRDVFDFTVKKFASKSYRTLLITYKDMSMEQFETLKAENNDFEKEGDREVLETGLTAIGIFGLQDPLRPGIVESIQKCRAAHITVIMCTGDNIDTAIAISKDATIVTEEECAHPYACMTGKQFREEVGGLKKIPIPGSKDGETKDLVANMKKFREIKAHLRVLARSSPEDKYILCTGIQDSDGVVAMTGDGTNDAPALTKADVGFSMGITGTDVAKGASDIILLDDNFSSIVVALRYGRSVYDNVRKFLQFQLTVNVVAMFIVFFGSVILKDSPLNAVQMLWVNLIMDTFAALALATEPPAADILTRKPYRKDAPIVTPVMWRNVFGHAIYQSIVLILVLFVGVRGYLVQDYQIKCLSYNDDLTCAEYNPFYTTELYESEASVKKEWIMEPALTKDDFNEALINDFICNHYTESLEEVPVDFVCDESIYDNEDNLYLPADMQPYEHTQKLIHFTLVFQIFVFMQIFNQINAKKIELGEINVFAGFFNNTIFIVITLLTFVVQMVMVEIGGLSVKCAPLTWEQNEICLAIGAGELIWGVILKFIPLKAFQCISIDDKPMEEEEKSKLMMSAFKKSATQRFSQGGSTSNKFERIN